MQCNTVYYSKSGRAAGGFPGVRRVLYDGNLTIGKWLCKRNNDEL